MKPHSFSACLRHPTEPVTGFCALCLHERLSGLDSGAPWKNTQRPLPSSSSLPELRRCKTYSGKWREARTFEPQRKSCDVKVSRNSLSSLFSMDGDCGSSEVQTRNLGLSGVVIDTVLETAECGIDGNDQVRAFNDRDEIGALEDKGRFGGFEDVELKTMKEFIDLECRGKKQSSRDLKDIAGSIWVAASVFSKKLHKWRRNSTMKSRNAGHNDNASGLADVEVHDVNAGHLRETRSEIGDYGFGRRSCDTGPRFSIDGGRMSLDHPRYSFDEPRASWDGYMIGRPLPRPAPMISVYEDVDVVIQGNANWLSIKERESSPGGSAQTRDYYTDPSNRRRKSFDQLGMYRKSGVVDFDEVKSISNAKVSPTTVELFHGAKLLVSDREMKTNSTQKDDCLEMDFASKSADFIGDGVNENGFKKHPSWKKAWSILGLLHKRNDSKNDVVGGESPTDSNSKGASGDKTIGSSSSVSSTSSCKMGGPVQSTRNNVVIKGHGDKKRDHVLERNRSASYSPNNLDHGLLRFYLTPLRSNRSRCGKSRLKNSHSITRDFLRF